MIRVVEPLNPMPRWAFFLVEYLTSFHQYLVHRTHMTGPASELVKNFYRALCGLRRVPQTLEEYQYCYTVFYPIVFPDTSLVIYICVCRLFVDLHQACVNTLWFFLSISTGKQLASHIEKDKRIVRRCIRIFK